MKKKETTKSISVPFTISFFTLFSALVVLLSFFVYKYQIDSTIEERIASTLLNLLETEKEVKVNSNLKIGIGYGACLDYIIQSRHLLLDHFDPPVNAKHHYSISSRQDLLEVFAYYFSHGAAAERYVNNSSLFQELIQVSEKHVILKSIGGNAPIMASRFVKEGVKNILLGAQMSPQLRQLLSSSILISGPQTNIDDVHLLIEYPTGERWNNLYFAPRANRFIVHNDDNNPLIKSMEYFHNDMVKFKSDMFVIGGLQMMENYPKDNEHRKKRLKKIKDFISNNLVLTKTKIHFEMASFSDEALLREIVDNILPYVESMGMNEQELPNLYQMLTYGNLTLVSDPYPRVATVLDQMRDVYDVLDDFTNGKISRIHVHTLAFQAILVKEGSSWKNTRRAAAKAALTAHRHTCGSHEVDVAKAKLIMDDSFTTTRGTKLEKRRMLFNSKSPVACWKEEISKKHLIQICVAPVLVCTKVLQTGGGGDNVSAAGLVLQI